MSDQRSSLGLPRFLHPDFLIANPPPFNPFDDLTTDEIIHVARIRADLGIIEAGISLNQIGTLNVLKNGVATPASLAQLDPLQTSFSGAADRLSADAAFLSDLVPRFGEEGFEYIFTHAVPKDSSNIAREMAAREGGFVPLFRKRLSGSISMPRANRIFGLEVDNITPVAMPDGVLCLYGGGATFLGCLAVGHALSLLPASPAAGPAAPAVIATASVWAAAGAAGIAGGLGMMSAHC